MSLILPISFYSSTTNNPPLDTSGTIFSVYNSPLASNYPNANFLFGSTLTLQSQSFSGAALVYADNTVDTYWKPKWYNNTYYVKTAAVSAGAGNDFRFVAGGIFSFDNNPNTFFLTVLNLSSSSPGVFSEQIFPTLPYGDVNTILIDDKIYVGGKFLKTCVPPLFTSCTTRQRFAAYNKNGTLATTTANANNDINVIKLNTLNSNEIYIGGAFSIIKGVTKRGIAKINKTTNANTTFDANKIFTTNINVKDIEIQADGKIIVGTDNQTDNNKILTRLASTTISTTTTYETFQTSLGSTRIYSVKALKIDNNGKLLAVLTVFEGSNSYERLYRFNLSPSISLDTTFASPNGYVEVSGSIAVPGKRYIYDIAIDDSNNDIIIVGDFLEVTGVSKQSFARIQNDGTVL